MRGFLVGVTLTACSAANTHSDDTVTHRDASTAGASGAGAFGIDVDASTTQGFGSTPSDAPVDDRPSSEGPADASPVSDAGAMVSEPHPSPPGPDDIRSDAGTPALDASVIDDIAPPSSTDAGSPSNSDVEPTPLRLCSWNLKKLGHGDTKDYPTIAAILDSECDASVLLEVMQKGGTHPGYEALLDSLGSNWNGLVTDRPRPNTTSGNSEFYAIVWRSSALATCDGWDDLRYVTDDDGAIVNADMDFFSREPAYACFDLVTAAGEVDFLLGAYHAIWGDGKEATIAAEVEHLDSAVDEMMTARPGERDVLLLGDFNLAPTRLAELSTLTDWTEGTGSTLNSTGARTDNLYDHLLVWEPSATPELGPQAEVLDVRHWAASDEAFFDTVSDHLPIRVLLTVNGPDDD